MKVQHHFAPAKFKALPATSQIKAIIRMIYALEDLHNDTLSQALLLEQIHLCASWVSAAIPTYIQDFLDSCVPGNANRQITLCAAACSAAMGESRRDCDIRLREGDGPRPINIAAYKRAQSTIVILSDLRSAFNVGTIFRGADCLAISQLWLCGITATPDNPALRKTAMGTDEHVDWRFCARTEDALDQAQAEGYRIVALETAVSAESVFAWQPRFPLALVLGNEALGLSSEVLARCEFALELPVMGWKNSLNVGVAFTAAAYQIIHGTAELTSDETERAIGDESHGTS